ncbi:activin receptor type-2B-like [Paramacrobiotus metropolitanus]|uniref:activin receptor type-2B-like n=1 Tax=Paramacrobiotus metropolitanus TaxID=2943436 RepID=UPI002445CC52|nr:activin receptor type-2B-like [Paramacrobiotus metropolitanus]
MPKLLVIPAAFLFFAPVILALICEHYDDVPCQRNKTECRVKQKVCIDEPMCYAFWILQKIDGVERMIVLKKGCWSDNSCSNQSRCISRQNPRVNPFKREEGPNYFCCCEGNSCNSQLFMTPDKSTNVSDQMKYHEYLPHKELQTASRITDLPFQMLNEPENPNRYQSNNSSSGEITAGRLPHGPVEKATTLDSFVVIVIIASILFALIVLGVLFVCIHRRYHNQAPWDGKNSGVDLESPLQMAPLIAKEYEDQDGCALLKKIQYLERKSLGRYGEVWKGKINEVIVAVKVTPIAEMSTWSNEVNIYKKFLLSPHPSILRCLMSSDPGSDLGRLLLVTEFHPLGSLMEVLKCRVVSLDEAEKIMSSMIAGIAFLHDSDGKPAIAHRDFKSTNVLIKSDLTACLADFGLASAFEPNERIGDKHGQVGTRRYMAPELLEGAISLNVASFLRVDIYACGLVMWEILSRTRFTPNEQVGIYKLPFEDELGISPTNEAVQGSVVHKRVRPVLKESWRKDSRTSPVCVTIEECWDADPEARPTASCLLNRARQFAHLLGSSSDGELPPRYSDLSLISPSLASPLRDTTVVA